MNPVGTSATGYHMVGGKDWQKSWNATNPELTYYPADILHSWANSANISEAVFARLDAPNSWINHASVNGCRSSKQDWIAIDRCVDFLRRWKRGDDPFVLYCSVIDPHPPYWSNSTWMDRLNETALNMTIKASKWIPLNRQHPNDVYQSRSEGVPRYEELDFDLAYNMSRPYYGQVEETDVMMGAVLDALAASEAASNTFTLFTSDHGELHLEHRHVEKMSHFEGSARVPMIVTGPGIPQGSVVTNFTSLIDILPTFLDMAHLPKPGYLEGFSLAPFLGGLGVQMSPRPDFVVSEFMGDTTNTGSYMIRSGQWKLITYGRDPPFQHYNPQLFDISKDPGELEDLASAVEYANIVSALDSQLRSVIDYPSVNTEMIREGRSHVKRWISTYANESEWECEVRKAYADFTGEDMAKFHRWLNEEGEFARMT